jgi:ABC-type uncharacterized transport system fused permease/ATPase subunit
MEYLGVVRGVCCAWQAHGKRMASATYSRLLSVICTTATYHPKCCRVFTDTTLAMVITLLNAAVDLVSFSEILYSIYPPLFAALVVYSVGGTAASLAIGRSLVGLNFQQEAQEANFRYGLVRVRENAESIAFYGGEDNEVRLLGGRLQAVVANFRELLVASRNLNFFTSFYRFLIQILPAAVVAPLYFRGEIEFGVINQSASGWLTINSLHAFLSGETHGAYTLC